MAITAPYNFVPLNKYIYVPEWAEMVSHDIPFSDGEDGIIELVIKNISPLFIRNASSTEEIDNYSTHVIDSDGNKHYFIPATTIKGMLNSVMEVFSFAKMGRFNDDYFAYRIMDTKQSDGKAYVAKMKEVRCGWLCKEEDDLFLTPCEDSFEQISEIEVKKLFPHYNREKTAEEKQMSVQNGSGLYPIVKSDYQLVCTGPMNNKKNEYLFPRMKLEKVRVPDSVKNAFMTVHKPTPLFEDYYLKNLKNGKDIPVFFLIDRKGEVHSIGLSRMYRYPYKNHVATGIKQEYYSKDGQQLSNGRDLCQTIWGYVDGQKALKGRVHIGNAFTPRLIADHELEQPVSGVLGEPSASYYPLYLKQGGKEYVTYDSSEIEIAGRKRYRIHHKSSVTSLPEGNGNEKTVSRFYPLPSGLDFYLKISVHNLKKIEIGALLSSITFHQSKAFHNMGLAKGYGYGKVDCYINSMNGFKYKKEEYLSAFEHELSHFLYNINRTLWADTEQVKALVRIANEHNDDELRIMSLTDYGKYKRNTEFGKLKEQDCAVTTYLDRVSFKGEIVRQKMEPLFNEACQLEANEQYSEAKAKYEEIMDELIGYNVEDIQKHIELLNMKVQEIADEKVHHIEEQRILANKIPLLEKIKSQTKIPTVLGGAKTWMKLNGFIEMPQSDKEILKTKLKDLYAILKPKEQNSFKNPKQWKDLEALIGIELSKKWFEEIIK